MKSSKKKVLLLFGGGASIIDRSGELKEVISAKDVDPWLHNIPEINLIAAIKPLFLYSKANFEDYPKWWGTIAKVIADRFNEFDGFIITQDVDAIPYTAAALSLMLTNIGKPVIITGSPIFPKNLTRKRGSRGNNLEVGIRANLVNATQVATLDVGEVAVLFGNRLIRGAAAVRHNEQTLNVFEGTSDSILGRVDFGLKIENHRKKRTNNPPHLSIGLKTKILQVTMIPSVVPPILPDLSHQKLDGIFVSGHASFSLESLSQIISFAEKHGVPLGVFSQSPLEHSKHFIVITGMTPVMAFIKFMWVLAQTHSKDTLQQLLETDIAGEIIHQNLKSR